MLTFSNPRRRLEVVNWPLGGDRRGVATFEVHTDPRRGERVSRTTTGKPKYTTYAEKCAIVDGGDGRTYVLQYSTLGTETVRIVSSDLQHDAADAVGGKSAYVRAGDPDFEALKALVFSAV